MNDEDRPEFADSYENFNEVLKDIRSKAGYSIASIARAIDVHRNTQVNYETDRDPGIDYLVAFCHFTGVSFWQLIAQRVRLGAANPEHLAKVLNEVGPLYSPANGDDTGTSGTALLDTCQGLLAKHQHNGAVKVFAQTGQSMAPTINEGDSLLVDTNDNTLVDGGLFLLQIADSCVARRFQHLPDGGGLIKSDNPQFESIKVDPKEMGNLKVIGRLVSSVSHY